MKVKRLPVDDCICTEVLKHDVILNHILKKIIFFFYKNSYLVINITLKPYYYTRYPVHFRKRNSTLEGE